MILVTLKSNAPIEQRIMQLHPNAIESLQDLHDGGCRVCLMGKEIMFDVEESVTEIARAQDFPQQYVNNINSAALEAFQHMVRMIGWSVVALGAIAVLMVFLVVLR